MFSITYSKDMGQSEAESKIDAGLYKAVLIIPQDYSERVAKNESVTLTLLTDDDQAFLNTIKPGDVVVARYKIKADAKTVPKTYGVDTVIRYENLDGDITYSSTLQAPTEVKEL